ATSRMSLPEHIIASNVHGRYCVPASSRSRPAAAMVLAGKVWEPKTIAYMASNCADGDIVHAGTYFGGFLPALSKALSAGAHLWALDPPRENYACAMETIELNAIPNATLIQAGLGERSDTRPLQTGSPTNPRAGGASRFVRFRKRGFTYEDTRIVAVDDI